ncbi:uncharacterized protein LOC119769049 [Culex quinquefasciatus]|uniref:uncharacterized protein LOC119769049 n=1 Tax=Culex quinquefasciatus TaxID=7176 RepID=UPI0018E2FD60|nr:uncharacterized protein LOC119769049 [Culex quinquefasciatus]
MDRMGVVKLNGLNYCSWKRKAEFLLIRDDLWRARATIGLLMEDSQLPFIKNATTAKLCWNALKDHFETVTLTSKVALLKRLCGMQYSEGENIQQHVQQMEEIFERLAMADQELDEDLCVAMILRSLPSSFNTLTTALEARSNEELTLKLVKMKLVDEVAKSGTRGAGESVLQVDHQKRKKVLTAHEDVKENFSF